MSDVTDLYYASTGSIGYGAQLLVGQGDSPETFTAAPNVKSITLGDFSAGVVDVTHLRSPGRHREKRGTIRDSGPITAVLTYDKNHGAFKNDPGSPGDGFVTGHTLLGLSRSLAENNFQLFEPDTPLPDGGSPAETGVTTPFRGMVTKYSISPLTIENEREVTIEITPLSDYSGTWA